MLVRNHLLCPYTDCEANKRSGDLRIQVNVEEINGLREVTLKKAVNGEKSRTSLAYRNDYEAFIEEVSMLLRPIRVVVE